MVCARHFVDNLLHGRRPEQTPHRHQWPHLLRRSRNSRQCHRHRPRLRLRSILHSGQDLARKRENGANHIADQCQLTKHERLTEIIAPSLGKRVTRDFNCAVTKSDDVVSSLQAPESFLHTASHTGRECSSSVGICVKKGGCELHSFWRYWAPEMGFIIDTHRERSFVSGGWR